MPVISKFYGIVIRMLSLQDYGPIFHACYGDSELVVSIAPIRIVQGDAPERVRRMVLEWARLRERELLSAWNQLRTAHTSQLVAPLE